VVRLLIDHVYAELDEETDEVVLWLKWNSGHHTELRSPRLCRCGRVKKTELPSIVETLCKILDDASISRALNRVGLRTESGETSTQQRMAKYRRAHGIAKFSERTKASEGWLTQQEAATNLGISPMSLNRLIQTGIVRSEGVRGLPQVILALDLTSKAVEATVKQIRSHPNAPLPTNPNQKTLFFNPFRKSASMSRIRQTFVVRTLASPATGMLFPSACLGLATRWTIGVPSVSC